MMSRNPANTPYRHVFTGILCIAVFILGYHSSYRSTFTEPKFTSQHGTMWPPKPVKPTLPETRCPSVLEYMTQGHWKTRQLTPAEQKQAEWFYHMALNHKGLPVSLQRPDGRCGDTGYSNVTKFIRAVCSPTGPTPCCFNFKCVNRTEQQCRCKNCWDVRQQIHAEYSTWTPSDSRCAMKRFSSKESCELLDGGSVYFFGDSLIRHIYTGFLMTLRGNFKDGAVRRKESARWKSKCSGMNMFEEKNCRKRLDISPVDVCRGRVTISWTKHYVVRRWSELLHNVTEKLGDRRTLFVVGIGIHENYNTTKVKLQYLKPTLDRLRKIGIQWPKFLFVDMNAPGIMKRSDTQYKPHVLRYNRGMEEFLKSYNIPVFKTYNLTDGVRSFDGTHYALGVNFVKANILMNYIRELRDIGQW